MRSFRANLSWFLLSSLILACGGADTTTEEGEPVGGFGGFSGKGGVGGVSGNSPGGTGGSIAGGGNTSQGGAGHAGDGGSGQSGAGVGGIAGEGGSTIAGAGGDAGASGDAGEGGSTTAGQGGDAQGGEAGEGGSTTAGQGGDNQGGDAGAGGDGQGGDAGVGQGGDAGIGQGGDAGVGQGGDAGVGQGGDNQGGDNQGGNNQGGDAGQGGDNSGCEPSLIGLPCSTGLPGLCSDGIRECVGGQLECVPVVKPGEFTEVCDGKDNDCDGQTDEEIAGTNVPCVVEGKTGPCSQGLMICDENGTLVCKPSVQAQSEICDGIDNNCDGFIDNNPIDADQPCNTGKLGPCGTGLTSCSNGKVVCEDYVLPSPEKCDGVDNNCDGKIDNGLADLSCGIGQCANTVSACVNGKPQTCTPKASSPEACDGKDNNCDGQVDENNVCCPVAQRCGNLCCNGGDVCSFQKCVKPGVLCYGSEDCGASEYCDYSLGTVNNPPPGCQGSKQKTGKCMPKPPTCVGNQQPGDPPTCVLKCEYKPQSPTFTPTLKFAWGGKTTSPYESDVMMTPIVVQLDDDDCDGKITERDIPEIVFTTFSSGQYTKNGTLRAISIVNGTIIEKWTLAGKIWASSELAAGNFDGNPGNEIVGVVLDTDGLLRLQAVKADGTVLWKTTETVTGRFPSIADLDGDGLPEIIMSGKVFNGKTGALKVSVNIGNSVVADINGDGKLDLVGATKAYSATGTLIVDSGLTSGALSAVADLDGDGKPEVITVSSSDHVMHIWRYDAAAVGKYKIFRQNININGTLNPNLCPSGSAGRTTGGGAPTVADFNGDGTPDVALAGGVGYAVFDGKKLMNSAVSNQNTFLWVKQTQDCSSAVTGSSLFDFNGDGKAEVLYGDELRFRIYEGATGTVLYETCNTTGTLYEYPVVADVDNDGQADIVVASNAYAYSCDGTKQSGIRIFGSKNNDWVRTRRVWNQHSYHITNVNEDGSIPKNELPNWTQPGLNNFRINKQPGGEFSAPDLVVSLQPNCSSPYKLLATVRNLGEAPVGAGVKVGFYTANGTKLGEGSTTSGLYPAEAEVVALQLAQPPAGNVYAIVDDNSPPHPWVECRTNNNKSATVSATCNQ